MALSQHAQDRLKCRCNLHGGVDMAQALARITSERNTAAALVVVHLAERTVVGRPFYFVAICKYGKCVTVEWTDNLSKVH